LRLEISERRPIAIVDGGGTQLWIVSNDGYWLGERSSETTSFVSIRNTGEITPNAGSKIKEPHIVNAVNVLASLSPQLLKKLASVSAPNVEETALTTKDEVEIFVGEAEDMREKDRIAREILKRQKGVVYINVRVTDRPTWRGLEGDLQ
jgi:cell division protein FtsQ